MNDHSQTCNEKVKENDAFVIIAIILIAGIILALVGYAVSQSNKTNKLNTLYTTLTSQKPSYYHRAPTPSSKPYFLRTLSPLKKNIIRTVTPFHFPGSSMTESKDSLILPSSYTTDKLVSTTTPIRTLLQHGY